MKTFTKHAAIFSAAILSIFQLMCGCSSVPVEQTAGVRYVDEFDLSSATCGLGKKVRSKTSVDGNPLVAGRNKATSHRGFGAHAESAVAFRFNGKVTAFDARIGLDVDSQKANTWKHHYIGARFRVWADGRIAYDSGTIRHLDGTKDVHVDLTGTHEVVLETTSPIGWLSYVGGNADWLDARFTHEAGATLECLNVTDLSKQLGTLTPPESPKPQFNGANVWGVRPGHEVIFRVPVSGKRPLKFTAENLPEGVTFDEKKGVLRGSAPQMKGRYPITVTAENEYGKASATIKVCVGDTLALTPPMGWNSWNYVCDRVSDATVRRQAEAMVARGLADHGYQFVNIDDFWQRNNGTRGKGRPELNGPERADDGTILPNAKFPDMKALADYVHGMGLKIGLYSSPGPHTCGGCTGSYGYEEIDAKTWAGWGYDYVKYDWCSYGGVKFEGSAD
ncbi:MAG: NPCBM/NEW2 domain-containing protein, partial [Kiritimatiellae bacterium]|nr:NPCBM/NEW2 domain-containing protein [Kiritimatiellia bacterium]